MNDFWKENDLDGPQGDLRALGHPQRPRQAQPWGVQQVPVMFIKNWNDTCLYAVIQRQIDLIQSQRDTGWSRGSWTPSATSSSSTMRSSASTTWVHKKLIWRMFIYHLSQVNQEALGTPSATSSSSTMASTQSTMIASRSTTWSSTAKPGFRRTMPGTCLIKAKDARNHTLLILRILAARLSSPGGLIIVFQL